MDFLTYKVDLWVALMLAAVLSNFQNVGMALQLAASKLSEHEAATAASNSALMAQRALNKVNELEIELATIRTEARMNGAAAASWQRRVEELEKRMAAGVVIHSGGDTNVGRDVAGRDHEQTTHG